MDISIIGATGNVGRQIAIGIARAGLVPSNGRLQLVGRKGGPSEQSLYGVATDLADAFAEDLPELDLAFEPKDVLGDIIILVAGDSVGRGDQRTRADLALKNRAVVESYAKAIAKHGHGEELLLVITNPVEPCVQWCTRFIDRKRVIGMGAYLDSLRFRQEIAQELGVRRQRVQGLVLGEHGPRMVPCWSTVDVHGFESVEGRARVRALQKRDPSVGEALKQVDVVMRERGARAAYKHAERFGPALRAVVKPMITQQCGARSSASTAEMILRLLGTLLSGGQVLTSAQVKLEGELLGIHGVVGAPIVLTLGGVDRVVPYALSADEERMVREAVYREPESVPKKRALAAPERARAFRCELAVRSSAAPGIAERVSAAFASRGISLRAVHATPGAPALITLRFLASPRVTSHMARRLMRMRDVTRVEMRADPYQDKP